MSPQSNPQPERLFNAAERAQKAVGLQLPQVKLPLWRRVRGSNPRFARHFSRQSVSYWWGQRPILGHLVTHRRRFTTGHKHKQPYRG